ncbi:unnamed protein product [Brachionus calyciflorus]|uniref:Cystatin domain-containing protein n=1 Tax=Brachionus calyciflorus TaxID=104777 RepID=A0A813UVW2_9BILA|nr:unnamed protein product [Brachionus calyciflorus]
MFSNLHEELEANDLVQEIVDNLRAEIEHKLNMNFQIYRAISYKTQTVRGTNYFIKLKISGFSNNSNDSNQLASNNQPVKFIHIRVWRDLPVNNFKLTLYPEIQLNKLASDPIDYFE